MKKNVRFFLDVLLEVFSSKKKNKKFCSTKGLWNDYFAMAEQSMDTQWDKMIWPVIKDFNFETVLELAPGAGRNTEKLAQVSRIIHAVDLNEYALEKLRKRFENQAVNCSMYFYKNEGSDLNMIKDCSITFIYCWDAAVHFDKGVLRDYIKEFSRVLKVNGTGFVHHSNLGKLAKSDISLNPGLRSNMTKELFKKYCKRNGLEIINQIDIPWGKNTDCISVFRKMAICRK
ncbi:MAG: class I SAM-dependent methyltransferase [Deltaproteobacteria bacterium]|nr:class I SAM-dependent methyltransferase [Deltaproteobacteria bacterium]